MTANELNDLLARGAGQPGVHEAEELMRIAQELAAQARDLAALCGDASVSAVSASTGTAILAERTAADHAHVG